MSVPGSLFIQPFIQRTSVVGLSPVEVLSQRPNFATVDNILVTNISNLDIFISIMISTGSFIIIPKTKVPANSVLKVLDVAYFNLNPGEKLLAYSDASQNSFNITVEGRSFTELV